MLSIIKNHLTDRYFNFLALRLYPSVPINSGTALRTVVLPKWGGRDGQYPVMVRKGEDVAYCAYVMHRRKDIYGDAAEVFRPKRGRMGSCGGREFVWLYPLPWRTSDLSWA
jgi:cytochrome P450